MLYTLISLPSADDELTEIWLRASDPNAITWASHRIDIILRTAPLTQGLDLGDYRVLIVEPLAAVYTVSDLDCMVTVLRYFYRH